ncbi:YggT family protein [Neomegalonema sp.]|uniref:YggT family protein n=1 Tax=Neomegalonema sp. TaxID=2039713 RepID=UPI002612857B|nr:YggT family protein [Neomegalonema sp.]MDD2867685.1 YggT family protein [Neomegalonema sp.]
MIPALIYLVQAVANLIFWALLIYIVLTLLIQFNIVNYRSNQLVRTVVDGLERLVEPMLRPIRRLLPDLGGIDLSPIVLMIGVNFVEILLVKTLGALA